MADFLTRLAARSLGQAPLARPVIPPLFATGPGLGAEGDAAGRGPSDAAGAVALASPETGPPAPPPPARPVAVELARPVEAAGTRPGPQTHSLREPDSPSAGPIARARSEEVRSRGVDPGPPATPAAARAVVPARPALRDREPPGPRRQTPSLPADVQPPAPIVRVFIGRVDVRAIVPPSAPARPAPGIPPERLSLGDYLRGETRRR